MISQALIDKLNDQMNYEFYSSQVYLAMAAYCSSESYDGFANFFIVQSEEEKFHAMKIFHFINRLGKRAIVSGMEHPQNEYSSLLETFEHAYSHEQTVTKRIYELSDAAWAEREHATINFLQWFIDEQVEEESTFDGIIQKLRRIDSDSNAFYMLDAELAKRTFSPEAEE
ncbi:ferritin [Cohnella xylanilytica]|uniref:Ferritin n=1 Tax=Cohnella xylanilytica TaxID=557555 RepID=A0A841TSC1_9BACL|nr:ferritin [Cohnella xylanilytica]MBB6691317.1 ferritin [Cohnella xylanilytica]